jgi:hypothetical protein
VRPYIRAFIEPLPACKADRREQHQPNQAPPMTGRALFHKNIAEAERAQRRGAPHKKDRDDRM